MLEESFAHKEAEELSRRMSASETLEAGSMSYSVEKGTSLRIFRWGDRSDFGARG